MSIHALPNTPSSGGESPNSQGQAPLSPPNLQQQHPQNADSAIRRKPSRRANTAERRATHNAVERARRETLNGRFLDLAALLPNLASVRRPSKSAIVNSSIALIHTQRRSRATAGRELRTLKAETDLLRHQLNELRLASGLGGPPEEEPPRSDDFVALLNLEEEAEVGEDERVAYEMMEGDEEGLDGEDDLAYHSHQQQQQAPPQVHHAQHQQAAPVQAQQHQQFVQQAQHMSRPAVHPAAALCYESPISMYDSAPAHSSGRSPTSDKVPAWNFYPGMPGSSPPQQQQIWAHPAQVPHSALFTPPSTSNGGNGIPPNPFANQAFLANYHQQNLQQQQQRQQQQQQQQYHAMGLISSQQQAAQAYAALSGPLGHHQLVNGDDDNLSDSSSGSPHDSHGSLPGGHFDMSSSVSSNSSGTSSIDVGPFAYNIYPKRHSASNPSSSWTSMGKPAPPAATQQFAAMGLLIQ